MDAAVKQKTPNPVAHIGGLIRHFRAYKRSLAAITGLAAMTAGLEALIVFLFAGLGSMLFDGTTHINKSLFGIHVEMSRFALACLALAASAMLAMIDLAVVWLKARTDGRYEADARFELLDSFLSATWELQAEERTGSVQAALNHSVAQARLALLRLVDTATATVFFAVMMTASLFAGGIVSVVMVVVMAAIVSIIRPLYAKNHRAATDYRNTVKAFSEQTDQLVHMTREIRVFAAWEPLRAVVLKSTDDVGTAVRRQVGAYGRVVSISTSLTYLIGVVGLMVLILADITNPQPYVAMILLLYRAMVYARMLQSAYQGSVSAAPFVDSLEEHLHRYRENVEPPGTIAFELPIETISFSNVHFAYPNTRPILHGISFEITRGDVVGLIGPSGAGKSTAIQLLLGFRDATSGSISYNGIKPTDYTRESWAHKVSLVPQDALLFDTTIEENVRAYRDWISREQIEAALSAAGLEEDMVRFEDGLDTRVGELGRRLSGGQRQRLCLARALVGEPEFLLLDEPTSSLDLVSENAICRSLEALKGKVTMVIVAHRMSTLRLCDRVLVLNGGRLEADGPRSELEMGNRYYAEAIRLSKMI